MNFRLLAQALSGVGLTCVIGGGRQAVSETLCPYEHLADDPDETKRVIGRFGFCRYIFRQCSECGTRKLKRKIEAAIRFAWRENRSVHWHVWELVKKVMNNNNNNNLFESRYISG